jgi:hypothetical protein
MITMEQAIKKLKPCEITIKTQVEKIYDKGYFGEPLEEDWEILEELKLKKNLR